MKRELDAKLLLTDADSLVYEIKTNIYEDFYQDNNLFDFSYYPLKSFFILSVKTLKMKNEFKGRIISEFIGLK